MGPPVARLPAGVTEIVDAAAGLRAFLAIDDTRLGPAAGGVRTRAYPNAGAARADALALARAMTIKCALAGLAAGGGKCVVMDHAGLDRERAFEALGRHVEALGGGFRTAGDLGTTSCDLSAMARHTRFVHLETDQLAAAAERGLLRCFEACLAGLAAAVERPRIGVLGAGTIGTAAARAARALGARALVADLDASRAIALARAVEGEVVESEALLVAELDILSPCAAGGVVDSAVAARLRCRALCGGANNVLVDEAADFALLAGGVLHVPDVVASAGAVTAGIARSVMGQVDPTPLLDALGATAREILARAHALGRPSGMVAVELARERLAHA